jgi:hypothetical protein
VNGKSGMQEVGRNTAESGGSELSRERDNLLLHQGKLSLATHRPNRKRDYTCYSDSKGSIFQIQH